MRSGGGEAGGQKWVTTGRRRSGGGGPVEVGRGRVGGDELAVDDEDEVEGGGLGRLGLLDVPIDVDTGVTGDLGIEPAIVLTRTAGAGEDHAESDVPRHPYAPIRSRG